MVEITSFELIGYSNEHLEERIALLYSYSGSGGCCDSLSRSKVKPWPEIRGEAPKIFFLLMPTKYK